MTIELIFKSIHLPLALLDNLLLGKPAACHEDPQAALRRGSERERNGCFLPTARKELRPLIKSHVSEPC